AVKRPRSIGHGHDVRIVELAIVCTFDEPGADGHVVLAREAQQLVGARTVGHRLGERFEGFARELAYVPVPREAHLGKRDDLDVLPRCLADEMTDASEVVRLVAGSVLKLDGCYSGVAHASI